MKSSKIEVIARGVLVADGKLLVCHTKGSDNTYLPGGHVEFNEDAKSALEREIMEEMGCHASAGRMLGVIEHAFVQKGRRKCELNIVFAMHIAGISPDKAPASMEDYIEFLWLDLSKLSSSSLEPYPLRTKLADWLSAGRNSEIWASTVSDESH